MRTLLVVSFALFFLATTSEAQRKLQEGFETSDSAHLPIGWTKWNEAPFPIDPSGHWLVQDTGQAVPGIAAPRVSVARSGGKAARIPWYAGIDTNTNNYLTADAWLITRRVNNIAVNDTLKFWAIGGNGGTTGAYYRDTLEVWLGDQDSLPSSQTLMLDLITWQNGTSTYGVFQQYKYPLRDAAGLNIFISFRYHTNVSIDGFVVFLDDVEVSGPLTDVQPSTGPPSEMVLSQNYPNPFNPSTTILWTVPGASRVTLKIYNLLGQEVGTLVDSEMDPGTYRTAWDASGFPAGAYFYRLQIGNSVQTRKLVLVK